jgi:hypothetical protein
MRVADAEGYPAPNETKERVFGNGAKIKDFRIGASVAKRAILANGPSRGFWQMRAPAPMGLHCFCGSAPLRIHFRGKSACLARFRAVSRYKFCGLTVPNQRIAPGFRQICCSYPEND